MATRKKATSTQAKSVSYYKLRENAHDPHIGSAGSACFDLKSCFAVGDFITYYNSENAKLERSVRNLEQEGGVGIYIDSGDRVLIPTGLIFDIPNGHSMRIHPRSGISLKRGLTLNNCEGVIDSDYVEELFISITNVTTIRQYITDGERLAQAEIVKDLKMNLNQVNSRPKQKTTRSGGFGSTGTK